jgi:pyruvate-formate lyase-activating enzyme
MMPDFLTHQPLPTGFASPARIDGAAAAINYKEGPPLPRHGDRNATVLPPAWTTCRFLTCSVLPVRMACNLDCKFCFSKSSVSALRHDRHEWDETQLRSYYTFARNRGAARLVITGGGEPLLRPEATLLALELARDFFSETALFTNGALLTDALVRQLAERNLSYLCFSRHHHDDVRNQELMGQGAPALDEFFGLVNGRLKVRATCVMCRGFIDDVAGVWQYLRQLRRYLVREFTFKHTYVAYERSLFGATAQNQWASTHQVQTDPFHARGEVLATLPWGPQIKRIDDLQLCYYFEPTPEWELQHQLARSTNLLADGRVYASLEDQRSHLFTLTN